MMSIRHFQTIVFGHSQFKHAVFCIVVGLSRKNLIRVRPIHDSELIILSTV